jgi:adenylate kinase family enzyme
MSVICLCGAPGSGKTTIAKAVAGQIGLQCGSFGDYVRSRAREQGLSADRGSLQRLGQSLVDQGPRDFCQATLDWLGWTPPHGLILEGLRHVSVYEALQALVHPIQVSLIFIDVDQALQRDRLKSRGGEELSRALMTDPTEREITWLRDRADLIVPGPETPEAAVEAITSWIGARS